MANTNTAEMNQVNLSQLEEIKNSGPGTYKVNYTYADSRGYTRTVPVSIYIPDNANIESINFHMQGKGGSDNITVQNYLNNNDHRSIDVFVATSQDM